MAEIVQFIKTHNEGSSLKDFQKNFRNQDDIHCCLQFGQQAIHMACRYGNLELVKYLVSQECKLDVSDISGWKPINWAIQNNNLEIVKILLEKGCNISTSNNLNYSNHTNEVNELNNNWQTIHHACLIGNCQILELLIGKECDIESRYNVCWRPIHIACRYGRSEVVELLIQNKCDIDAVCKDDWRPIHYACYFGYVEIVELLCQNLCEIEHKTANNLTVIDLAQNNGNEKLIEIIGKQKLIYDIAKSMELQCDPDCDHSFCRKSFCLKTFKKGKNIGHGSFGSVYLCNQSNSVRKFALKKISMHKINKEKKIQKYVESDINCYREKISHPRIIRYFGVYEKNQYLWIFMEYAAGGSLINKIKENMPHEKIISYTKEILEGVKFLHKKKIIHRDIKPSNILLDINDNIKLCDFGLSRSLEDPTREKSTMDASTACGTQVYLAPEILLGKKYKYSGDIWSIGATVTEMVSGKSPYSELTEAMAAQKIMGNRTIIFKSFREMSQELENLIEVMLNPACDKRATAEELLSFKIFETGK